MVVDFDPVDDADRRAEYRAAAPGEFGEPVLVVQARVAPPGGFQRVGQADRGRGLDQRDADVLTVCLRRVQLLGDLAQQPGRSRR